MGTLIRFALGLVALVAILALGGYFLWLHNPHHDALRLTKRGFRSPSERIPACRSSFRA